MKKIYYMIYSFIVVFLFLIGCDTFSYIYTFNELVVFQETICKLVSKNGGITDSIKSLVYEKEMFLEYEKSSDINGATYEFTLCKKVDYILSFNDKYIRMDLTVILGY